MYFLVFMPQVRFFFQNMALLNISHNTCIHFSLKKSLAHNKSHVFAGTTVQTHTAATSMLIVSCSCLHMKLTEQMDGCLYGSWCRGAFETTLNSVSSILFYLFFNPEGQNEGDKMNGTLAYRILWPCLVCCCHLFGNVLYFYVKCVWKCTYLKYQCSGNVM